LVMAWTETPAEAFRRNQLIKLGFEEADDIIMCQSCNDAVATQIIGRGLGEEEVCTDCYYEIGDRGY